MIVDVVVVPECIHIGIAVAEAAGPDSVPVEAGAVDPADIVAVVEAVPAVVVHDAAQCFAAAKLAALALTVVWRLASTPVQKHLVQIPHPK